jgi:beta-lactamase regulating signal transducer with metallopeptidase domain
MQKILAYLRWFFMGLRLFLPFVPRFVWMAFLKMKDSTVTYWKNSQSVVNQMTDSYTDEAMQTLTTEYDTFVFWACYSLASTLYLLGWLAMAWLTVEAFRLLTSWMF